MEKISSILPTNSRVRAVDMESAQPIRPGAPAFGQPLGNNAIRDRITIRSQNMGELGTASSPGGLLSTNGNGPSKDIPPYGRNARDQQSAKIVKDIADKFFLARTSSPTIAEEISNGVETSEPESVVPSEEAPAGETL